MKIKKQIGFVALFAALLPLNGALAEEYKAKVVAVVDGDTLKVQRDGGARQTVILQGVDCPEMGQDFGTEARKFTNDACYGKVITIQEKGKDKFQRVVADVSLPDGTNLSQELVRQGLAWWSDKFARNDAQLKQLHTDAKAAQKGLWSAPNPIPPWTFRNGSREVQAEIKLNK